VLRVRILHPDPAEWKTGVDLVYESYWSRSHRVSTSCKRAHGMVRLAALQYKMWDGKRIYVSYDPRIVSQCDRAHQAFCEAGLCQAGNQGRRRYALPHCSVFLRPTDRVQRALGFAVSHAWHIPVCEVRRQLMRDGTKLESRYVSSSSVSQGVFAELFNRNMLGSRWLQLHRLESIYKRLGVLNHEDRVIIHAQEFGEE
jgi:hypothetical protein